MSSVEIRVCGRYRIEDKLYEGRHASVYMGRNVQSDSDCAIKCEPKNGSPLSFVMNEGRILQALQGGIGIPQLNWFGENGDFRFLVTELLGNSLEEYLDICGGKFTLKTTLMIADKVISSIEFMHYKNFVHRDIKPANFLMGLGKKLHQIYAIDMAYSTTYKDPVTHENRPNVVDLSSFVGTLKFASLNVHKGCRNTCRDDLQSIGLMLIYFLKGKLPWESLPGESLKQKRRNIRKCMEDTSLTELCEGLPKEIEDYMQYCRSLSYDDIPDYGFLKRILKQRFIKDGYQFDFIYDWILIPLRLKDTDLSNRIPINRFTKKEDPALSMCNSEYNFSEDFSLISSKHQEKAKKEQSKEEEVLVRNKRAMSTSDAKKPAIADKSAKPKVGKGTKDDCRTF